MAGKDLADRRARSPEQPGQPARAEIRLARSTNGALTFGDLAVPAAIRAPTQASIEDDGRIWIAGDRADAPGQILLTIAPGGHSTTVAQGPSGTFFSAPARAFGHRFVAVSDLAGGDQLELRQVEPEGLAASGIDLGATGAMSARLRTDTRGLWVIADATWRVDATGRAVAVDRLDADPAVLAPGARRLNERYYRPLTPEVWWPIADDVIGPDHFQAVDGGVLASFVWAVGVLPQVPVLITSVETYGYRGALPPDAQALIDASNRIRRQQGLPT